MSDHEGQFVTKVGAVYRTVVLASYHEEKVAALEAELAKLRAGQEPVAWVSWTNEDPEWKLKMLAEPVHPPVVPLKLYTAPQPSAVPDGCMIVPIQPTEEMRKRAQDYLAAEGMIVSDWLVHTVYTEMLAAAPSAPKANDPVKQMLLEALENTATWIEQLPVPTVEAAGQLVKIDKAIAAAREVK